MELSLLKEITYIETFDGSIYPVLEKYCNVVEMTNNDSKFLNIGDICLNKTAIKKVFQKDLSEVDKVIYSITDKDLRNRIEKEIKKRDEEGKITTVGILQNIIQRIKSEF